MPRHRSRSRSRERVRNRSRSRSYERPSHKRRSRSRSNERKYNRRRSPTPERKRRPEIKREPDLSPERNRQNSYDRDRHASDSKHRDKVREEPKWGKSEVDDKKEDSVYLGKINLGKINMPDKPAEKEKPSFEPSGKLAADTNTFRGVVIKYNEPPDAKLPKLRWRLYPFKGDEALPAIYIHRQSAYLIGRDRKIADFPVDHPSCSKQHAAFQYRSVAYERPDGSKGRRTRPYIIDLGSGNGTYLNGDRIEAQRYYELKEKDVIKFGFSSREYVVLHENSLDKAEGNASEASEEEDDEDSSSDEIKKEAEEEEEEQKAEGEY